MAAGGAASPPHSRQLCEEPSVSRAPAQAPPLFCTTCYGLQTHFPPRRSAAALPSPAAARKCPRRSPSAAPLPPQLRPVTPPTAPALHRSWAPLLLPSHLAPFRAQTLPPRPYPACIQPPTPLPRSIPPPPRCAEGLFPPWGAVFLPGQGVLPAERCTHLSGTTSLLCPSSRSLPRPRRGSAEAVAEFPAAAVIPNNSPSWPGGPEAGGRRRGRRGRRGRPPLPLTPLWTQYRGRLTCRSVIKFSTGRPAHSAPLQHRPQNYCNQRAHARAAAGEGRGQRGGAGRGGEGGSRSGPN